MNPGGGASESTTHGTLGPQFPHISLLAVLVVLTAFDLLFLVAGQRQFRGKAVR
jgi:hypothetical protein